MQPHGYHGVDAPEPPAGSGDSTASAPDTATATGEPAGVYPVSWRWWPVVAMVVAAGVLIGVGFWSQTVPPLPFGFFSDRPLYGIFQPIFSPLALTVIPSALLFAGTAWAVTSSRRLPSWLALALTVLTALITAVTIALVRGDRRELTAGVSLKSGTYYTTDLHYVAQYGVRGFVKNYPILEPKLHAYNGKTHPPGVQVFLWIVYKISGHGYPLLMTTIIAAISLLTAVGAWAMARSYGGERAGRIAAALAVAAPGPLLLAYTNLDVVFAATFSIAGAFIVVGAHRRSAVLTGLGGLVIGFATFLTYATTFLVFAVVLAVIIETRSARQSLKLLAAAAVGGAIALAILRFVLDFDPVADYRAVPRSNGHYYHYWIIGGPSAWLIWAGLPLAAIGLAGLVIKVPAARRPILPLVLIVTMLVWGALPAHITGLRQGEVERTWAFLYPMLAASAGPVVDRWTHGRRISRAWAGPIVAGLLLISIVQTGVIQALWDNLL
jgi:Dolichyl-phosphate-mannose-protein mannosyltransferase